jgi:hypothetical protein
MFPVSRHFFISVTLCVNIIIIGSVTTIRVETLYIILQHVSAVYRSRDSAVGIAAGYRLDDGGVGIRVPVQPRIFTSPCRPDQL